MPYTGPVPLHNASSREAQLSQLDNFSFYDSFGESRTVYLVYFYLQNIIWFLRQVSGFFVYFDSLKISGRNDGRLLDFHLLFNCSTSAHRWMWNRLRSVWPRYSLHHFLQKQQVMTWKLILRCVGSVSLRWLHSFGSGIKQKQSLKFWCPFIAQNLIYIYILI